MKTYDLAHPYLLKKGAKSESQRDKFSWTMRVVKSVEHKGHKRRYHLLARLEHIDVEPAVHGSNVETRMCYDVKIAKSGDRGK